MMTHLEVALHLNACGVTAQTLAADQLVDLLERGLLELDDDLNLYATQSGRRRLLVLPTVTEM